MSRALQICLMVLTTALCVVCVAQWQRESRAAARERGLALELETAQLTLRTQNEKLAAWEQEIARLNTALADQAAAQNALPALETKLTEATRRLELETAAAVRLSATAETLVAQLKKAMDERDALAIRLNERTREYNALAGKIRNAP